MNFLKNKRMQVIHFTTKNLSAIIRHYKNNGLKRFTKGINYFKNMQSLMKYTAPPLSNV